MPGSVFAVIPVQNMIFVELQKRYRLGSFSISKMTFLRITKFIFI